MKKRSLVIAIATLLTASVSFAATSTAEVDTKPVAQIYSKDFKVMVKKASSIVVVPPKQETIQIGEKEIKESAENGEPLEIGSMEIKSTSKNCFASVRTKHDFKLVGEKEEAVLASYGLYYSSRSASNMDMGDISAKFDRNQMKPQRVNCNTADLALTVFKYNDAAPADIYTDIIRLFVKAES